MDHSLAFGRGYGCNINHYHYALVINIGTNHDYPTCPGINAFRPYFPVLINHYEPLLARFIKHVEPNHYELLKKINV